MNKNKYLTQLTELISVLSKEELKIARKFIVAFESNLTFNTSKQILLFDAIRKNQKITYEKLKIKVAPLISNKSFDALLVRISVKLQELLLLNVNILRNETYGDIYRKRYQTRKELIQARILYSKGLINISYDLFNNIIKRSVKYELYDEIIEALLFKLNFSSKLKGEGEFSEIRDKVRFFQKERDNLTEIRFLVHEYTAKLGLKSDKLLMIEILENYLQIIYQKQNETTSNNSLSILLLIQIEYFMIKNETKYLINLNEKLLNLLINNPSVYSKNRIIYINNELAKSYLIGLKFNIAKLYIDNTLGLIRNNYQKNYINSIYIHITILIYKLKYQKGYKLITGVLDIPVIEKFTIDKLKFVFLKAVTFFGFNDYKASIHLLNDLKLFEKDKDGWNLWIRIMRILCSIELLRLNLVDYDIENFRKYIERLRKESEINPRVQLILKILVELDRCNYDFKKVAIKRKIELANLRKTTGKYKWDIKSPEMILFHDWFEAKLLNQEYKPNLKPYREQVKIDEAKPLSKAKEKKYRSLGLID